MSLWHMTLLNFSQLEDALKNGRFYLCVPLFEVFSLHFCLRTPNCGPILNTNNTNLKDAILKTNCIKHCKLIIVLICVKYKYTSSFQITGLKTKNHIGILSAQLCSGDSKQSGDPDPQEGIECLAFPYKLSLRLFPL